MFDDTLGHFTLAMLSVVPLCFLERSQLLPSSTPLSAGIPGSDSGIGVVFSVLGGDGAGVGAGAGAGAGAGDGDGTRTGAGGTGFGAGGTGFGAGGTDFALLSSISLGAGGCRGGV